MNPAGHHSSGSQPPSTVLAAYQRALDSYSIVSITDRRGYITYANAMFCEISGYDQDELLGATHALLNSGYHEKGFFACMWRRIAGGETWTGEICNRAKDGSTYWVDTVIIPLLDESQQLEGYMSVRKEISARKEVEQELQRSENFLKNVADVSKVGGWSLELDTQKLYWSEQTKAIHDLPADYEPRLDQAINFYAPEARPTITHAVENAINTGESWDLELPMITATGRHIWVRAVGHLLEEKDTAPILIGAFQDISDRKRTEDALREEVQQRHTAEELLRDVLETIPDAVAAYDRDDRLMVFNKSYQETYAASAEAIVPGARFEDIIRFGLKRGQYAEAGKSPAEQERWLAQRLAHHANPPEQLSQKLRDGTWLQVREHRSSTGTTVGVRTDITAIKRAEEKLRRFAEEDPLTGLFNRSRFCLSLDEILAGLDARSQHYGCVVLFDVDHFKPINDAYGHDVGDEVLVEIANRLRSILGSNDIGARLGGDEFVFVLTDQGDQRTSEKVLQRLFDLMEIPVDTSSGPLKLSLSMGAAPFIDGSMTSRQLLKQADIVQYRAKEQGRAQWCWFGDDDRKGVIRDAHLGRALETSLTNGHGMNCHLTPVANAHDGSLVGYKGEVAWTVDDEVLTSSTLRSIAQKSGLSRRLCDYKLRTVLSTIGREEARGIDCSGVWMTVNGDCLKINEYADGLEKLCDETGVAIDKVTIAVDESALTQRSGSAVEATLKALSERGFHIAIDLFGSASSSVSKLKTLGIDKVQLDPNLTDPLVDQEADDTVVRGLVVIARTFGIAVFAANVNTPAHAERLAELGCDALQGPLIGEPVHSDQLADHLGALAAEKLAGLSASMRKASESTAEDAA